MSSLLLCLLWCSSLRLQAQQRVHKQTLLSEWILTLDPWIVRWRPLMYSLHSDLARVDLMVGHKTLKGWYNYLYYRSDSRHRKWLGYRTDYNFRAWKNRFFSKTELRYFAGLNRLTQPQVFLIESMNLQWQEVNAGILAFYRETLRVGAVFFAGPTFKIRFSPRGGIVTAYTYDLLSQDNLILGLVYYRINLKRGKAGAYSGEPQHPLVQMDAL